MLASEAQHVSALTAPSALRIVQKQQDEPVVRNGRPTYRPIPSRRSGFRKIRKLDYLLYSSDVSGFNEWLLDRDDDPLVHCMTAS